MHTAVNQEILLKVSSENESRLNDLKSLVFSVAGEDFVVLAVPTVTFFEDVGDVGAPISSSGGL